MSGHWSLTAMAKKGYAKQRKRDGKWGFDLYLTDPATGQKTRRIRIYEWDTRIPAEAAAVRIVQADRDARYGGTKPTPTPALREVIERRLASLPTGHERTRAARVLTAWLDLVPAGLRITEVTTPHIRLYVELRQADGQSPASINRELNIVAATLNSARDFFADLAQWRSPKIPRPKVSKSRRERIITDEEYRALLAWLTRPPDGEDAVRRQNQRNAHAARRRVAAILEFAMLTGMRPKEIYTLTWGDVDFTGGRIRVRGTKTEMVTDSVRYVPLSEPARTLLEAERAREEDRQYVWTKGGNPTPKIYRIFREACEAVGITYGNQKVDGFVLYCARHTFATRLLQAGADLKTVGEIMGHTDSYMTLHYSHVTSASRDYARALIEEIESKRWEGG